MPVGTCDMIIHTDDMLFTPGSQYGWFTQGLKKAGLKITSNRTVEAHTGIKITYGETEDGMSTCTITQPQSIKKMAVEFKTYIDARRNSRRTAVQLPMAGGFKHEFKYELDLTDKTAVAEHKAFPYRGILGHIMWICYTHPEVWHASRVLARHSHHHTKHRRDALLGCAWSRPRPGGLTLRLRDSWGTEVRGWSSGIRGVFLVFFYSLGCCL